MDARNAVQRIVAILVVVAGACGGAVYARPVYIYGGDFNLPIPAMDDPQREYGRGGGRMDDAVIEIPHSFIISDLDVRINITHTNVFDLQLFLKGPYGPKICLNYFDALTEYDIYPNYINTIFDDEAETAIEQAEPPFTGRFRPIESYKLSKFDGEDASGHWRLQILDRWPVDTGTLNSFELMITIPEPATVILLALGSALLGLFKPRRSH